MRFLFVTPGFPGVSGASGGSGVGTYLAELTRGLIARGHSCDVLVWGAAEAPPRQTVGGVNVTLVAPSYWPVIERFAPDSRDMWTLRRAARRLSAEHAYDWIEIESEEGLAIGVQRDFPERAVLRVHTTLEQMVRYKEKPLTPLVRRRLRREEISFGVARRVHVSSRYHLEHLERRYDLKGRAIVVPLGVGAAGDPVVLPPPREPGGRPRFLVVGSADRRKGFDRLRPVLDAYSTGHGRCVVAIVSDCDDVKRRQFRLDAPPVAVQIEWLRGLTAAELWREYAAATALLHLARYESFGLPLIEAAAAGTPVVATPVGVAPDLLGGTLSRFLVDGDDPRACADALAAARDREPVGRELRRRYESSYTRDRMVEAFLAALGSAGDA